MDAFDTFVSIATTVIGERWRTILIYALLIAVAAAGYYHVEIAAFIRPRPDFIARSTDHVSGGMVAASTDGSKNG